MSAENQLKVTKLGEADNEPSLSSEPTSVTSISSWLLINFFFNFKIFNSYMRSMAFKKV